MVYYVSIVTNQKEAFGENPLSLVYYGFYRESCPRAVSPSRGTARFWAGWKEGPPAVLFSFSGACPFLAGERPCPPFSVFGGVRAGKGNRREGRFRAGKGKILRPEGDLIFRQGKGIPAPFRPRPGRMGVPLQDYKHASRCTAKAVFEDKVSSARIQERKRDAPSVEISFARMRERMNAVFPVSGLHAGRTGFPFRWCIAFP